MNGIDSLIDPGVSGAQQDLTTEQIEAMRAALLRAHPDLAVSEPRRSHNSGPNRHEKRADAKRLARGELPKWKRNK